MSKIQSSAEDLVFNADGANNDLKFQSNGSEVASIDQAGVLTAGGASLTGVLAMAANNINLNDNGKVRFGSSNDLNIYHDGSNSYIEENTGTGSLIISTNTAISLQTNANEIMASFTKDGAVVLRHNNVAKIGTTATGIDVSGGATMTGEIRISNSSATSQLYLYGASGQKSNIILNQYGVRAWHIGSGTLASGQLSISDGTTERMRFQHGGVVSIPSGIELGSGVDNTAANTLNDYEEGTWTPTFQAHGQTNPSVGYTINNGHYTKVGRLVTASLNIVTSSVSGGNSGHTLELRGLPFAQKNVSGLVGAVTGLKTFNWNGTANNPVTGYVDANQSFAWLNRFTDSDSYDTGNLVKTGDLRTSGDSNQIVATIIYYAA